MNILKMELNSVRNTTAIWTVSIVSMFVLFIVGIFPVFLENAQLIVDMLIHMPPAYIEAFGMNLESFSGFTEFYQFTYLYLAIMGSIMASLITLKVFCKEKQNKAHEFLFAKPISRKAIFGYKFLAVWIALGISNAIYVPLSIYYLVANDITEHVILASVSMLFLEVFCMCLSVFLSIFLRKIRSSASLATGIGFLLFIINAVADIVQNDSLFYLSPFAYYQPITLWEEGHYDWLLIGCSTVVMILFVGLGFWKYTTSDVESV